MYYSGMFRSTASRSHTHTHTHTHSPELVESEPYTEKVDIWAAGCILYQMALLKPPFYCTNILALAKKVEQDNG